MSDCKPTGADADRWRQLEAMFEQGAVLADAERAVWLAALDIEADMREQLVGLLAADQADHTLRERVDAAVAGIARAPARGERIGAWRLLEELGSGGMGTVFLVERADGAFEQRAALKLIRGVATRQSIRQLRHERQVLAALEHPGIARLLDGGETAQGQPWLVVEYVRGEPITRAVQARDTPLRERVRLLREVALAVHHAHRQLVIHRDIKPANVLLREDGRPVLLDFGIAKLLGDADPTATGTAAFFTPAYASPEQRQGRAVSTAADVYALGLLLAELIASRPARIEADGRVRPPSEQMAPALQRAVRGDLDRIVARACAVEPERRYESAAALANDIDRYLAGEPLRAAPDSRWYVFGKFVRRHPASVAVSMVAALLLGLSAWQVVDERNRAWAAEQRAAEQARASQAVTDYLIGLFDAAEPGGDHRLSPSQLIDRGVARLAGNPAVEPAPRARLLGALGAIYHRLGLPQQSSQVLQQAVQHARDSGSVDVLAAALHDLGTALDARGELDEAHAAMNEAWGLYRQAGAAEAMALVQASIGLVDTRLGRYEEAEARLLDAERQLTALHGAEAVPTLRSVLFRTELLRETGRTEEARAILETLISRLQAQLPAHDPILLEAYGYYGNTLLRLDENALAQQTFEYMLEHRQRLLEHDRSPLGFVHNGLGMLYYQQGRTRDAAVQMAQALAISEHTLGADAPSLALDLNNVASLYEEMGDYPRAEPLLRRALAMASQAGSGERVAAVLYRQNLGRLLMLSGKSGEALPLLQQPIPDGDGDSLEMQRARRALHLAEWHRRYGDADQARHWLAEAAERFEALTGTDSPRYAAVLRARGLLALAAGRQHEARADLQAARERIANARGEAYIGVGEIDLELAELHLPGGDRNAARLYLERARPVIEAVAVDTAPQRQRLARASAQAGLE
jgi:eukaryotic-like serine/threonine-protein kinase